jgi:hypothetical protein
MKNQTMLFTLLILFAGIPYGSKARVGDQYTGLKEYLQKYTILMVVGDDNETVEPGHGTGDIFIRDRLEKVLSHEVILIIDTESQDRLNEAVESADLVIVSESAHSQNLRDKLKSVPIPVINYEAFIQDEMGMTALEPSGDPGEPEDFAYGVRDKDTAIDIIMKDHPLASGLKGHTTIYKEPKQVTWGKVGASAKVIATLTGRREAAVIYLYDKGVRLFDGTYAAGMRIGFFLEEENITGTSNFMTGDGLRLFDAAVKFALEAENVR